MKYNLAAYVEDIFIYERYIVVPYLTIYYQQCKPSPSVLINCKDSVITQQHRPAPLENAISQFFNCVFSIDYLTMRFFHFCLIFKVRLH